MALLEAEFVDTGKVNYIVSPFHLGHPEMALATEAAWCAADQNEFFKYQRILYENFGLAFNPTNLTALASEIGLNQADFSQCLSNRTHQADVEEARRWAASQGINSTPTFLINNRRVEGNQPYEVFQNLIEQELAAAQ